MPRTIPSSEENLLTAPPNLTTLLNPGLYWHEPTFYEGPIPRTRGIGQLDPITGGIAAGLQIAQMIGNFLVPSITGMQAQDATTIVNGLEVFAKKNLATFMAHPSPEAQGQAMSAFEQIWNMLIQGCSQLAGPGTKCVNDRSPGGKWDWWAYYYDPIANYQFSTAQVTSGGTGTTSTTGTGVVDTGMGFSLSPLLLLGVAGVLIMIGMKK